MEKAAVAVPPAGTFSVFESPPLTEQLPATPLRVTVWLPASRPLKVGLLFVPIPRPSPPPSPTAASSGSWLLPDVLVVTVRSPVSAAQAIVNAAVAVPPAG